MKTKHYALKTRKLARQFVNILKEQGHTTTQPTKQTGGAWLVSTNTDFKKPTRKQFFIVTNGKAVNIPLIKTGKSSKL